MMSKTKIICECGREVTLEFITGQYLDEYGGDCECGRKWFLKELTEVLSEISDSNEE